MPKKKQSKQDLCAQNRDTTSVWAFGKLRVPYSSSTQQEGISYILGYWNQTICLEKYIWERHIRDDQCDIDGSKPTEADHIEIIRTIDSYLIIVTDIGSINERYTCRGAIHWAKNITVGTRIR